MYFIATDYDGDVHCDDHSEMVAPQLSDLGEVLKAVQGGNDNLFLPFADSFDMLNEVLYQEVDNPRIDVEFSQSVLPYRKKPTIIETSGADDFNESDHPRDENGRFTEGGGGSESSEDPEGTAKQKKAPKPTKFTRSGDKIDVAKDTSIKIANSQNRITMAAGSITGVKDFAGVSGKKPVEKEPELLAQYPNSTKGSWKHSLGYGKVKGKNGKTRDAEIHWFESDDVGQVGWKVKRFGKGGKKK